MPIARRLTRRFRRFLREEDGLITTESIIVMPLLVWVFLALFVYWDAFRAQNTSIKASYVIADIVSRENTAINNNFITGMHQVFDYMVNTPEDTWIRVSSVQYRQWDDRYLVLWSRSTDTSRSPVQTTTTLATQRDRLPILADADTLIVVETWRRFRPAFWVGLPARTFYEFTVVRPRFLSPLPIS